MKKQWVKKLISSRPDIEQKHGRPMSRRDLFAQGYIATGAYVAMPSILSLVSAKAYGQDCRAAASGADAGGIPVLIIDGAGGWGIPGRNVMVGGAGGQMDFLPAGSYGSMGIMPAFEPTAAGVTVKSDFGLVFNAQSHFYRGMSFGQGVAVPDPASPPPFLVSAEARALTDGRIYCVRSGDDQRNNPWNPSYWLRAAGAEGSVVSLVGNDSGNDWGANSMGPTNSFKSAYKPVSVRNPADVISLVLPGILATAGGDKFVASIMNATKKMSEAEVKRFAKLSVEEQFQITCAYANANFQAQSFSQADVDPAQDTVITDLFSTNGQLNGTRGAAGSMAKLLLDGYAGVASLRIGGCDYHNNMGWENKDNEIGDITGRILEAAHRKGKPIMIINYTDGGVSANTAGTQGNNVAATGHFGPTNDSGTRSSAFSLVYNPAAKPEVESRQAGSFNSSGAVDTVAPFSDSPSVAAELMVLDYLNLRFDSGTALEEFAKITGSSSGPELTKYVGYKKLA